VFPLKYDIFHTPRCCLPGVVSSTITATVSSHCVCNNSLKVNSGEQSRVQDGVQSIGIGRKPNKYHCQRI